MRNSVESISEIKNISGRRSIRKNEELSSRKSVNNNEDRSISEPPQSYSNFTNHHNHQHKTSFNNVTTTTSSSSSSRLKPIREKMNDDTDAEEQGSSDEDDLSKSNSQLNESDLDLEIPDSVSQTPTPIPLGAGIARRINSETNLNDSKRRMTGFMGNRSKRFCASTSELCFTAHLDTRKSLFSPKNNQRSLSRSSLYGSNTSLNSTNTNSRLFMLNSPFYSGKTMFGGASAYPKRDINQQSQLKVLRTPVQMRPSSSLSNSSVTSTKSDGVLPESNAAKRILEIMNQFSSGPLKEARSMGSNINSMMKLPGLVQNQKRFGQEELNVDRSINLSRPSAPYGRPFGGGKERVDSPLDNIAATVSSISSNKPLQIPTMTQLMKMKRLQNNTERVREIANRSQSFLNQIHDYKLPEDVQISTHGNFAPNNNSNSTTSASSSLKMKNNFTKNLLRNDKGIDDQQLPPAPLNLPNIQLPEMKSIPKFDIQLPASSKSLSSSNTMSFKTTTTTAKTSITATEIVLSSSNFTFSKPLKLSSSDFDTKQLKTVTEYFNFSKPSAISSVKDNNDDVVATKKADALSPKQTASLPPPTKTDNLFKTLVAQQKSMWECDDCLTRNDSEKTKCMCCEKVRADSGIASSKSFSPPSNPAPIADDLFKNLAAKQKSSQWECDVCMCKNDLDKEKCLSCETPKPGSKPAQTISTSSSFKFGMPLDVVKPVVASDDLFKSLVAQQKKTRWECDMCMTGNDVSSEKCVACETPKPGSKPAAPKSSFSFGMPSTTQSFSFGMPASTPLSSSSSSTDPDFKKLLEKQSSKWECSVCMVRNDQAQSKCMSCEHPKPGSSDSQPQFLFGSSKSSVSLPKPSEVKFSFGVSAANVEAPKIVESTKTNEILKEKTSDEVDKPKAAFSFGANNTKETEKVSNSNETPTFTFKAPSTAAPSPASISASFTIKSPSKAEEKKEEEKPSGMFSFGANKEENAPKKKVSFEDDKKVEVEDKPAFGGFKFGGFSDLKKPEETKKDEEKPLSGGFSFSSSANMTFGGQQKTVASTSVPATTTSSSTFAFGSPKPIATTSSLSTTTETKTTFGAFSSPSNQTKAPFSFGSTAPAVAASPSFAFGSGKKETVTSTQSSALTNSITQSSPAPPGFSFGSNENKPGGFAFNATTPAAPSSNPVFGSQSNTTPSSTFGFASKTNEVKSTFGGFASPQTQTSSSPFGNSNMNATATTTAPPVFGSNNSSFTFGGAGNNNKEPAPSSVFTFGGKPSVTPSTQPTMIFGNSNAASSTPNLTPVFGSNASNNNPNFTNNNNESGFGSKMMGFGNNATATVTNAPHKRAFDFGSAQPDVPHKKFEFGSQITPQQQAQQPQNNSSPFQFNAQPQIPQQQSTAFNFNANSTAPPAFNFSAGSNASSNAQENLFQFGANNSSTIAHPQRTFASNIQPQSAPVMQFGATAPSVAIPGINSFGPAQSNASANRKILRAARRTHIRR